MPRHLDEAERAEEEKETGRAEAFSDGVFAIAITLLVLDLKVPTLASAVAAGGLRAALLDQWPGYLAYVISFLTILIMWINHHALFTYIVRTDHVFLILNGLLLLVVAAVPFPTALLAQYLGHPGENTAMLVYAGTSIVMGGAFNVLWRYAAAGRRLLTRKTDLQSIRAIEETYRLGFLYVVCFVLAFFSVAASLALALLLAVAFAFPPHFTSARLRRLRKVGGSSPPRPSPDQPAP